MNRKQFNNYTNINELKRSDGKLNNKIIIHPDFKTSILYQKICDKQNELKKYFKNISFSQTVMIMFYNYDVKYCKTCGNPYVILTHIQKVLKSCEHHMGNFNHKKFEKSIKNIKNEFKNKINNILTDPEIKLVNDEEVDSFLNYIYNKIKNEKCGNFLNELKNNIPLIKTIIVKTQSIIPFKNYNDLCLSERCYLIKEKLTKIPKCKICEKNASYNTFIDGYRNTCGEKNCVKKYASLQKRTNNNTIIINKLADTHFELISKPNGLNNYITLKCKKCNHIFNIILNNGRINKYQIYCPNCEHITSKKENELYEFIQQIIPNERIIHSYWPLGRPSNNSKNVFELDVYIPSRKIAFEFNGTYWHDNIHKNKNYHQWKFLKCKELGIHLIQIWEFDWNQNEDLIKNKIKNILGIYDKTIFARKCIVQEISSKICNEFLTKTHIQGPDKSKIRLGLFHNDELISVMTFSKPRFNKKYDYELIRFSTKYHIPGAGGKLLTHFIRHYNPNNIITYADISYSNGNLYNKLGFKFCKITTPSYFYIKNNIKYNRITFQKHKLSKLLSNFNINLTEEQNMINNGYLKIYDCGNYVFEYCTKKSS